jgi:hypothetical protein
MPLPGECTSAVLSTPPDIEPLFDPGSPVEPRKETEVGSVCPRDCVPHGNGQDIAAVLVPEDLPKRISFDRHSLLPRGAQLYGMPDPADCLDHVIVLGEEQLRRILASYFG